MKVKVLKPVFAESASLVVNKANQFEETILFKKEHWVVDAKSLLGILALSLQPDQTVEILVKDTDNKEVYAELLNTGLFKTL
ncbi:HPr family phosphocarrier protein [Bacillus taeanensis]|uniref:HPr family phosphocarrier protein n=1 Tax=Bacillus taeanensis TaxID=273032 RepID=A0A366XTT2_9BACI|nr:HPr family phosphocarrier protein [Bacillus taeanensis]RBW68958.1 HPr family phosphocarrier protein [Bacillus taeanensis]